MADSPQIAPLRTVTVPEFAAIPGLVHGFERRLGPPGWEARPESRRRVAAALTAEGRLLLLKQVHGSVVAQAPWESEPEADAGVAALPRLLLGIETADCLPALLVDPRRHTVAAAHAGWRGTAAGVVVRALEALLQGGSRARDVFVALGPGIGPCCYEVGDELREAFGRGGSAFFRPGPRGRLHLDVRAANVSQLETAGVPRAHIHHVDECTFCRGEEYHSYRREGKGAGRMINYVGWRE
jgi:YfiH family protein